MAHYANADPCMIPRVSGIMYKRISHDYSSQQLYFNQNIDNITQTNINLSEKENIILKTYIRFLLIKVSIKSSLRYTFSPLPCRPFVTTDATQNTL